MEDRYFKILEYLSKHGIEQTVDAKKFLVSLFSKDDISVDDTWSYLELMGLHGHIN